jgi:hypothetical protein
MKIVLPLLVTLSVLGTLEHVAEACAAPAPPEGYIVSLSTYALASDDPSTALVCRLPVGACNGERHKGLVKRLVVTPVVKAAPGTSPDEVKVERFDGISYVLRNATGGEIERVSGGASGYLSTLGATVCVQIAYDMADTGVPSDRRSELCAPVTVSNLEVTAEDLSKHEASLAANCPDSGSPSRDSGTVPGDAAISGDGDAVDVAPPVAPVAGSGCRTGASGGGPGLAVLAALLVLGRRTSRRSWSA